MGVSITYRDGGLIPGASFRNIAEVIDDHGDGTGTLTTYDEHGNVTSVEHLTGLPIPEPVTEPTDPVAMLVAALRSLGGTP